MGMKLTCLCGHEDCDEDYVELEVAMVVTVNVKGLTFERKIPLKSFLEKDLFKGGAQKEFDGKISMYFDANNNRIFIDPKSSFEKETGVIGVSVDAERFQNDLSQLLSTIK
jgi:hypothetical protein